MDGEGMQVHCKSDMSVLVFLLIGLFWLPSVAGAWKKRAQERTGRVSLARPVLSAPISS